MRRSKTKKLARVVALAASLALLATACGGDGGDGDGGAAPTDGGTGGEVALPDLSGESCEVAAVWSGGEQESFEEVLSGFEEQTGASVTFTSTGDNPSAVLGTRIEGGDPPDVAILPQPGLVQDFVDQGALTPVSSDVEAAIGENYAEVWRQLGTYNGELYGVWFKAANKSTVWYNVQAYQDAGAAESLPESWDDFKGTLDTLSASGVTPLAVAGADGWTLTDWFENVYLTQHGGDLYDQLANHEIPWTHESVITTLNTLAEVFGQDQWLIDNPLQVAFPDSVTATFGDPPTTATVYEGDFVGGVINNETQATVGEGADFYPFPNINNTAVVVAGDQAVLMKDSECGQALMTYLALPQAAEAWAKAGGFISPNKNVPLEWYPNEIQRRLAEQVVTAEQVRFDLSDLQPSGFGATPGQGMFKLFQDFLGNPSAAQDIAQQLEDAATQAYGG